MLLFVQNKDRAKQLYNALKYDEIRADVIHADLSQIQVQFLIKLHLLLYFANVQNLWIFLDTVKLI